MLEPFEEPRHHGSTWQKTRINNKNSIQQWFFTTCDLVSLKIVNKSVLKWGRWTFIPCFFRTSQKKRDLQFCLPKCVGKLDIWDFIRTLLNIFCATKCETHLHESVPQFEHADVLPCYSEAGPKSCKRTILWDSQSFDFWFYFLGGKDDRFATFAWKMVGR